MGGAQITVIILYAIRLLIASNKDGEKIESEHYSFSRILCNSAIGVLLLWWGGFWVVQ